MGPRFEHPWFLLLLIPLILYGIRLYRDKTRLSGLRRHLAMGLRLLTLMLMVLACSGLQWARNATDLSVVFVVDRSDSMQQSSAISRWIREAAISRRPDDRAGIVSFGGEATVERKPSAESLDAFQFQGRLMTGYTDMAAGLRLGAGLLPSEGGRIVLISDGRENTGVVLREAGLLKDRGIPVDVLAVAAESPPDAAVEWLSVPKRLYQGEGYAVEVGITSNVTSDAILTLYENDRELATVAVHLERGDNRFAIPALANETGLTRYRAEIAMPSDGQGANNTGYAFSRITGQPRVLIVEAQSGTSDNVANALETAFIETETILPEMLPDELSDYARYDSLILNNVPATRLSARQMGMIEQSVREYGMGLVMLGGPDSFGLGGFFQTPVEKALPVYMDLRGKREIPSLGLVLVLDKSGSMAQEKMALAKEAALRTVELLREKDTVGVLAFDSTPWWVVNPQPLTDKEQFGEQIRGIQASGGTDIYPALEEAYEKLAAIDAQRKHIILLTDGHSSGGGAYSELAARMKVNGITVSTVAIGDGADTQLLETIARLSDGRYYFTNDMTTVPAIFSREAILMSRTYVVEDPFVPALAQGPDWLELLGGSLPIIRGYVATTPKETAEAVLVSPEPDPLLARWQYGAGKSVAWTSDMTGRWSADWVLWDRFPRVVAEWVKWTFPAFDAAPVELSYAVEDGGIPVLTVRTDARNLEGTWSIDITDDSGRTMTLPLTPAVPGEFVAELPRIGPGVYTATVKVGQDGESAETRLGVSGFVVPYSSEYAVSFGSDTETLRVVAEMTGGRMLEFGKPEEVFAVDRPTREIRSSWVRPLLVLALLLWIGDIAVRRLSLPRIPRLRLGRSIVRPVADTSARPVGKPSSPVMGRSPEPSTFATPMPPPASSEASRLQPRPLGGKGGWATISPDGRPSDGRMQTGLPEESGDRALKEDNRVPGEESRTAAGESREDRMARLLAAKSKRTR